MSERNSTTGPSEQTGQDGPRESPVLISRHGPVASIVLNRPKAINALTHEMVKAMQSALDTWADDPEVGVVLLTGAGDRGLCAGGDIVSIYRDARSGGRDSERFWADEYRLNATIAAYPKPYVAVMDGIVLGGGVGVSAHGSHRLVTSRTRVGLPEVGIGFIPDVGATWLLSRAPGELGTFAALTAGYLDAADAIEVGLADHMVNDEELEALPELLATTPVDEAIARIAQPHSESALAAQRSWIDAAFGHDDLPAILNALTARPEPEAHAALTMLRRTSPTSQIVTLRALRSARGLDLEGALAQEYRVAVRMLRGHDFPEGIRAQVIDKDRTPQWVPATVAEVDPAHTEHYFTSLGAAELTLEAHV